MKYILFVITLFMVAGCIYNKNYESDAQNYTIQLEQEKSIAGALDAYTNKFVRIKNLDSFFNKNDIIGQYRNIPLICGDRQDFMYTKYLIQTDLQLDCICSDYDKNVYESDECILYRRKLEYSPISFFDYKRFLPDTSFIQTEQHFAFLSDIWKQHKSACDDNFRKEKNDCEYSTELTTKERKICIQEAEKYYNNTCLNIETWLADIYKLTPDMESLINLYHKECDKENWEGRSYSISYYMDQCLNKEIWFSNKYGTMVRQKNP